MRRPSCAGPSAEAEDFLSAPSRSRNGSGRQVGQFAFARALVIQRTAAAPGEIGPLVSHERAQPLDAAMIARTAAPARRAADERVLLLHLGAEKFSPVPAARDSRRSNSRAASSAMPIAPTVPGFGGTMTSLPVCRATAAARASAENGMPWQKITLPIERLPLTRFR